ncbi:MAG: hypothetical protein RLZZ528_1399 [Pseudomonadota bacterium]
MDAQERPGRAGADGQQAMGNAARDEVLIPSAHVAAAAPDAAQELSRGLGTGPFTAVFVFASPTASLASLAEGLGQAFPGTMVLGCTTAGEISRDGYAENEIVAIAFPARHFAVDTVCIDNLDDIRPDDLAGRLLRARNGLAGLQPGWAHEFAFLMVDGMSLREDELTSAFAIGLGPVPLFGGSAGDGTRFRETHVLYEGRFRSNAAVLAVVRTDCPVRVFSLDHLVPSERRMVVTEADPARRIVRQINAEPAAREYARLLGKDPTQLTSFTFAAHPVVVRLGGKHHVRAIQQMADNGDLVFFSAIDEGLVLTLAEPQNMVEHLDRELRALNANGAPAAIIACDCILRRMEAEERQMFGALSAVLQRFRVTGFSTYGEQLNTMHVNQTMTGVAIYPPEVG